MRNRTVRRGLTLVELLVVIAIIGVALGILVPIIQRTRETAARAQCTNNLKEIGMALGGHLDADGVLPAGYISGVDPMGQETGPGWGWATAILPRVGQQALFDQIQMKEAIDAAANANPRATPIAVYRCPSDRSAPRTWTAKKYDAAGLPVADICEVASGNYLGVFGIGQPGVDGEGLFFRGSAISLKDITDGLSTTLAISERDSLTGAATWTGAVTGAQLAPRNSSNFVLGHTGGMMSPAQPTENNNFASQHPDGVNYLFADGHVQFLTASMPAAIFQALSTRNGGETLPGGK